MSRWDGAQRLLARVLPLPMRTTLGLVRRPQYSYCMWQAARLAKRLGLDRISVLEFGVAGGNGLVAIEAHAEEIRRTLGMDIAIYGFDTGGGLPAPVDYRDLPYHWRAGFFAMDQPRLRRRLRTAQLVLGDVRETARVFHDRTPAPPIGCMFHDLDFYSSTRDSFQILEGDAARFLPRVFNYFDDIVGNEVALYNDFTGQRLAIREFNEAHPTRKFAPCHHLVRRRPRVWHQQIFVLHDFAHPRYNAFISQEDQQLPLR